VAGSGHSQHIVQPAASCLEPALPANALDLPQKLAQRGIVFPGRRGQTWHRRHTVQGGSGGLLQRQHVLHAVFDDVVHCLAAAVEGRGESIPLPDASADAVFVSSAWHWMDPERTVPEIARVLRDGGRFGVIWTSRDHEVDWVRELNQLREPDQHREPGRPAEPGGPDKQGRPRNRAVTLPDGSPFGRAETASFAFQRVMTISGAVAMLGTYSGLITASPQDRAVTFDRLRAALEQWFPGADEIEVPMRSVCWRADRTARPAPGTP